MNVGLWEFFLLVVGLGFYGFVIWMAWTLVMSVKGIRKEIALLREDVRNVSAGGPAAG